MLNPSLDRNFLQVVNSVDSKPTTRKKRAKETNTPPSLNGMDEGDGSAKAGPSAPRTSKQQLSILSMLDPSRKDRRHLVESRNEQEDSKGVAASTGGDVTMDVLKIGQCETNVPQLSATSNGPVDKEAVILLVEGVYVQGIAAQMRLYYGLALHR